MRAIAIDTNVYVAFKNSAHQVLAKHHGDCPVVFNYIDSGDNITCVRASEKFAILPSI